MRISIGRLGIFRKPPRVTSRTYNSERQLLNMASGCVLAAITKRHESGAQSKSKKPKVALANTMRCSPVVVSTTLKAAIAIVAAPQILGDARRNAAALLLPVLLHSLCPIHMRFSKSKSDVLSAG